MFHRQVEQLPNQSGLRRERRACGERRSAVNDDSRSCAASRSANWYAGYGAVPDSSLLLERPAGLGTPVAFRGDHVSKFPWQSGYDSSKITSHGQYDDSSSATEASSSKRSDARRLVVGNARADPQSPGRRRAASSRMPGRRSLQRPSEKTAADDRRQDRTWRSRPSFVSPPERNFFWICL
jgi:hypothetical protein